MKTPGPGGRHGSTGHRPLRLRVVYAESAAPASNDAAARVAALLATGLERLLAAEDARDTESSFVVDLPAGVRMNTSNLAPSGEDEL